MIHLLSIWSSISSRSDTRLKWCATMPHTIENIVAMGSSRYRHFAWTGQAGEGWCIDTFDQAFFRQSADSGSLSRTSSHCSGFRRTSGCGPDPHAWQNIFDHKQTVKCFTRVSLNPLKPCATIPWRWHARACQPA